ncbi:MAG TPA: hemolysin-type calcium-binding protein, partial [Aliiroseovarius sp.]|nr:hemolysin-type calcium-binding protein [Aliiroseovarius sp.]
MKTGYRGTFVISWTQTEVDGLQNAPKSALGVGSSWRWSGNTLRVDGPDDILELERGAEETDIRKRAAKVVHRLVGAALNPGQTEHFVPGDPMLNVGFEVTDGHNSWVITLVGVAPGPQPLL